MAANTRTANNAVTADFQIVFAFIGTSPLLRSIFIASPKKVFLYTFVNSSRSLLRGR
jgi:hypothetical protein